MTRRERESRAYALGMVSLGAGGLAVVLVLLAVFGVVGLGPGLLAAVVAAGAGYGFRRTVA
ncbi:hypothetical protein [Conexibacter sp. SYSU D00693]|uniref:hypothetical protein n=1 Tax=Conexibacter sp. SYSU D00693 TaxID=2812560 RepID=UPI00196A21BA|nr:hypothetical protein [Conexibacter sp. SYSU D00693]